MKPTPYLSFLDAMKKYHDEDEDVVFHGKEGEIRILFDADMSQKQLSEMTELDGYTFFDLTNGLWSTASNSQ